MWFSKIKVLGKDITDKIDKGITFDFEENKYELIFLIFTMFIYRIVLANWKLFYVNDLLVFKTSYDFGEDDDDIIPILIRDGNKRLRFSVELVSLVNG